MVAPWTSIGAFPATAPRCATGRPPSRCICCGASCVATPERVRLFVALELPSRVRSALATWRSEAVGSRDDLRLVAPASLHVTLAFLGSRPADELEPIATAVSDAVAGARAPKLGV